MAEKPLSTTRRAILGVAASLPVLALAPTATARQARPPVPADRLRWNDRLARYRRLAARAKAAAETGWFRAANDLYYRKAANPPRTAKPPSPASSAPRTFTGAAASPR